MSDATRDRNGPDGRSVTTRGTAPTHRCAGTTSSPDNTSSIPSDMRISSRRPARCKRPSKVSTRVVVTVRRGPNTKPNWSSEAIAAVVSCSGTWKVATDITDVEDSVGTPHTVRVAIEIERKFILPDVPSNERLGPGTHIRQGYIAEDGLVEVRVRITDVAANLTVKAGAGLSRTEVDSLISAENAEALWPHTVGRRIDKTRHRVNLDDTADTGAAHHVAEVDIYSGTLAGLHVAEVEFTSETDAAAFNPPDWFGPEVTGDPQWSNAALARRGRPGT